MEFPNPRRQTKVLGRSVLATAVAATEETLAATATSVVPDEPAESTTDTVDAAPETSPAPASVSEPTDTATDIDTAAATATANLNRMLGGQQIAATKYRPF